MNIYTYCCKQLCVIFLLCIQFLCISESHTFAQKKAGSPNLRYRAMNGPTIQIDPTFPYYLNRSNESIVDEIFNAGYRAVHYFVVNENNVNGPLIDAFRKRGMPVWLMAIGNGTYDTKGLPAGWENWKMQLTKAPNGGGFTFFSLSNQDFVAWKKKAIVKLINDYPFDGVELAESYFPEWDAIKTGRYGDVGPEAKAAFQRKYSMDMPDFVNPESDRFYTKNPLVYKSWVQFRVDAVNEFLNEIYNGEDGVRAARPDILVATWSMGVDAGPNSVIRMREDHGLDALEMVEKVKPDVHFFQTHWPDWIKPEAQLKPEYVKTYHLFADPVRQKFPKLPLGFQADQGSGKSMIKSEKWRRDFDTEVKKCGYATWTTYEYHLGGAIYTVPPRLLNATIQDHLTVRLSFNKRIDSITAGNLSNYSLSVKKKKQPNTVRHIRVDGNLVFLTFSRPVFSGDRLSVRNVTDTPELRLYKDTPANLMKACTLTLKKNR